MIDVTVPDSCDRSSALAHWDQPIEMNLLIRLRSARDEEDAAIFCVPDHAHGCITIGNPHTGARLVLQRHGKNSADALVVSRPVDGVEALTGCHSPLLKALSFASETSRQVGNLTGMTSVLERGCVDRVRLASLDGQVILQPKGQRDLAVDARLPRSF